MHTKVHRVEPGSKVQIKDLDPDATPLCDDKAEGKQRSAELQERLGELQELMYAEHRQKVLVILQGMDTSGKDGTVRHVMSGMSPAGVRVTSFRKPTSEEIDHDFLWRVHAKTPGDGEIAARAGLGIRSSRRCSAGSASSLPRAAVPVQLHLRGALAALAVVAAVGTARRGRGGSLRADAPARLRSAQPCRTRRSASVRFATT